MHGAIIPFMYLCHRDIIFIVMEEEKPTAKKLPPHVVAYLSEIFCIDV